MSHDCFWIVTGDALVSYWSNVFPVAEPQTSLEKLTWPRLLSFLTWRIVGRVGLA